MTKTSPQITDIKCMANDPQLHNAVNTYLMAKAYVQTWRERVDPIQRDTLKLIGAVYADKHSRKTGPITDPKDSWLMSDEQHREWCDELDHEYRSRGWLTDADARGVCPALKVEELERQAARAVLMLAAQYVEALEPDGLICSGMKNYRKGLEIVCGLIVNHSTYRKPAILAA